MRGRTSKKALKSSGLIQVYTGDGKGKTTASLGLALRAVSQSVRVAIVHFDKGGTHYAERGILGEKFAGQIDLFATGLDRINPKTSRFRFGVTPADMAEAERGLATVRDIFRKGEHGLVQEAAAVAASLFLGRPVEHPAETAVWAIAGVAAIVLAASREPLRVRADR